MMESRMRFLPMLRALMVLAFLPFAAVRAQDIVVVNADNAKLHQQPSMTAPGTPVTRGTSLTVLERNGYWITVFDGRAQGFVHSALVVPARSQTPQAVPSQRTPSMYQPKGATSAQPYGAGTVGMGANRGQVRFPGTPGYKDGTTSRVLGLLIPGGEAFYTGHTSKGIIKAALGYGGLLVLPMVVAGNDVDNCFSSYDASDCSATNTAWAALAGWGIYTAMVIHGVVTGGTAADAANRSPMYGVSPMIQRAKHGGTMLGLRVPLSTIIGR